MISQNELINGTLQFINRYKRLPYLKEDDIEVEKENDENELEIKPYRANKYIINYFNTQDEYTKYLLDNKLLTYEKIAKTINMDKNRIKKLVNKEIDNPDNSERRQIEIFFNKDYYSELGIFNFACVDCTKKCKQPYWVMMVGCNKYKQAKTKTKK